MTGEFVDTNVLLYAYDDGGDHRHDRALELLSLIHISEPTRPY